MRNFRVISIHGAPRSGTSWIGKIFDSHPDVAYRFQPLFSYRFKSAINLESSSQDIEEFLQELYELEDDDFIFQSGQQARGVHPPRHAKFPAPSCMVMKEVRYHYLIETLLQKVDGIKIVGVVRHPCGAINSWLKTPREFKPGWDKSTEWRNAPSKNLGRIEEYYGFAKWKELAYQFVKLEESYRESFFLLKYEDLISDPIVQTSNLFKFCNLEMVDQVHDFLVESHAREVEDPDTVYRTKDVGSRWRTELDRDIQEAIHAEIRGTVLERFLSP